MPFSDARSFFGALSFVKILDPSPRISHLLPVSDSNRTHAQRAFVTAGGMFGNVNDLPSSPSCRNPLPPRLQLTGQAIIASAHGCIYALLHGGSGIVWLLRSTRLSAWPHWSVPATCCDLCLHYFHHHKHFYYVRITLLIHQNSPYLSTPHISYSIPGSSRLYRLVISQAQKAMVSRDERPRLRAS